MVWRLRVGPQLKNLDLTSSEHNMSRWDTVGPPCFAPPCFAIPPVSRFLRTKIFLPVPVGRINLLSLLGHFNALLSSLIRILIDKIALQSKWKHVSVFCSAIRCYRGLCCQLEQYIWIMDGYMGCLPVSRSPLFRGFCALKFSSQNPRNRGVWLYW